MAGALFDALSMLYTDLDVALRGARTATITSLSLSRVVCISTF